MAEVVTDNKKFLSEVENKQRVNTSRTYDYSYSPRDYKEDDDYGGGGFGGGVGDVFGGAGFGGRYIY